MACSAAFAMPALAAEPAKIAVEFNDLQPADDGCRAVFVLNNGKPVIYPEVYKFLGTMQKITSEMPKAPADERYL